MRLQWRWLALLGGLGLGLALGLWFWLAQSNDPDPKQVAAGKQVYGQYCASCHGAKGEGQIPAAPLVPDATGKIPAPPHDSTGHTWHHDDDLLKRIIHDGGLGGAEFYEMPAFGAILTNQQIDDVLVYIKTLWTDEQRERQRARTEAIRNAE
jgi:mono/diheme cytochrome c family protein